MEPIVLAGKTVRTLISPSTGLRIPVMASRGLVFSAWSPSPEELKLLNDGKPLWAVIRGTHIPEFSLIVGEENMVVPRDIRMDALTGDEAQEAVTAHKEEEEKILYWSEWLARVLAVVALGILCFCFYFLYQKVVHGR